MAWSKWPTHVSIAAIMLGQGPQADSSADRAQPANASVAPAQCLRSFDAESGEGGGALQRAEASSSDAGVDRGIWHLALLFRPGHGGLRSWT